QAAQSFIQVDLSLKANPLLCVFRLRETAWDSIDFAGRAVFRFQISAHHTQQTDSEIVEAGFHTAGNIENFIRDARFCSKNIRARNILNVDEIHGLFTITQNERGLTSRNALHPANQNLGIRAIDVHARPVNVKVPESDVAETVHFVEAAEQAFVENLCCTIERA